MQPEVNLYAEFLLNIRQVTIFATLEDAELSDRSVIISSDKKSLTVTYDDVSSTIAFPSGVSGTATVEFPVEKRKNISLRLEITEDDKPPHAVDVDNDTPWPATSLSAETRIACRSCRQILIEQGTRQWKDLPREHWAELMDLWHCHKPHEPHTNGTQASSKGYAAGNRPKLRQGLAFVDTSHLLVAEQECGNLQCPIQMPYNDQSYYNPTLTLHDTWTGEAGHRHLRSYRRLVKHTLSHGINMRNIIADTYQVHDGLACCSNCDAQVGIVDEAFEGIRLYKWCIFVLRHSTASWEQNDMQNFVCAQLLGLIESQAAKRFVVRSDDTDSTDKALLLWVFNPDLKYSASYLNDGRARRAMKVLYKEVEDAVAALDSTPNAEELVLPQTVMKQLRADLDVSNGILPTRAKELQGWHAALLDRFDPLEEEG